MSLTSLSVDRSVPFDRVAVPVGLAVLTWIGLLLAVGYVARLGSLSVLNLLPVFFVGLVFWPVYRVQPWRAGATDRVRAWAGHRRVVFPVVVALAILPLVPFVPDLLVSLLQLPYRGAGVFFGASLFYRQRFGPTAARLLLFFGQSFLELLWLYYLSVGLVGLVRRLR